MISFDEANQSEGPLERDGEPDQLAADLAGVRDQCGRKVVISGAAGISKTALDRPVGEQARAAGMLAARAPCTT